MAPGRTFYRGKVGRRDNATLHFRDTLGIHHAKRGGGVALLTRPAFEPLFTTHPSEVGSTSQLTLLAAMLRTALSHPICRQATTFCGVLSAIQGASAWSSCLLSARCHDRCVIASPCLPLATNCNLTRHHPIHAQNLTIQPPTAQVPSSCLASTCSDVSSRPPCNCKTGTGPAIFLSAPDGPVK